MCIRDSAKTKCVLSAALALSLLSLRSRLEDCLSHIYLKHINKTETTGNAIKTMKNENETNVSSSFGWFPLPDAFTAVASEEENASCGDGNVPREGDNIARFWSRMSLQRREKKRNTRTLRWGVLFSSSKSRVCCSRCVVLCMYLRASDVIDFIAYFVNSR